MGFWFTKIGHMDRHFIRYENFQAVLFPLLEEFESEIYFEFIDWSFKSTFRRGLEPEHEFTHQVKISFVTNTA